MDHGEMPGDDGSRPDTGPMHRPLLGRVFFFDSSVLGSGSIAWSRLKSFADEGWIELWRASALSDDLSHDRDEERAARLNAEGAYPEMLGILVLDEARLNGVALASTEEAAAFERLFAAVSPGTDRSSAGSTASHKRRYVMHLHTTKKYGADGFITRDDACSGMQRSSGKSSTSACSPQRKFARSSSGFDIGTMSALEPERALPGLSPCHFRATTERLSFVSTSARPTGRGGCSPSPP
jgi:hypothetical protein